MSLQTGNVDPKVSWLRTVHLEETQHLQEKAKQHAQQQQEVDISEQTSVVAEVIELMVSLELSATE